MLKKLIIIVFLCLPMVSLSKSVTKDTTKISIKEMKIDKGLWIQSCIENFDYFSLMKISNEKISIILQAGEEILSDTVSRFDALDILGKCQITFEPQTYDLFYAFKNDEEQFYISLKKENEESIFILMFKEEKMHSIIIVR